MRFLIRCLYCKDTKFLAEMQEFLSFLSYFPALFSAFCDFAITAITYLSLAEGTRFRLFLNNLH